MKTTNLRLPTTAMGVPLGSVALLFLPQALSVEARTSDESIAGLTLASGEPGILTVTRDAADPPPFPAPADSPQIRHPVASAARPGLPKLPETSPLSDEIQAV